MKNCMTYFFLTVAMVACSQRSVKAADAKPKPESLDKGVVEKVRATYNSVLNNDDKKAKLLYGRNYKNMPEAIQFALDLRFKNYEHALTVLPKTGKSPEEIKFWEKIVSLKPNSLSVAICDSLKNDDKFPAQALALPHELEKWLAELRFLTSSLLNENSGSPKKVSELDEQISQISCGSEIGGSGNGSGSGNGNGEVNVIKCEELSQELQALFLNEKYFDNLHNLQRRDTRFVRANYRNFVKLNTYQRFITPINFLKLYYAIKSTPHSRKEHYLRRLGGIGRDLRVETLATRYIGDEILGDESDKPLLTRLSLLTHANLPLNLSIGLEYELASCGLGSAPNTKGKEKPKLSSNDSRYKQLP